MDTPKVEVEKWGFPLQDLYRLATIFYKKNVGKDSLHLSYDDNLKLIAFKQQTSLGPFDRQHAPELGVLDVIGRDRRLHWQMLGDIRSEQAMEGFIDLLDSMCSAFRPYVEAVKQNRDETLQTDLRRMEKDKFEREQQERQQKEIREEVYKEEMHRRQLQDALNIQTYHQFKRYADKQFPGNPEQQGVLIRHLQQEHYYQYVQLHMDDQNALEKQFSLTSTNPNILGVEGNSSSANESRAKTIDTKTETKDDPIELKVLADNDQQQSIQNQNIDENDYVVICPAKIWTRNDIVDFKADVSAGDGDGVITIGHGDTVTVRVPTNVNGKCLFWEFATDNYDIGFGVYFEWSKPLTNDVTVHVTDSDDDDDYIDEDYLTTTDDLECGSLTNERNDSLPSATSIKPPISIIVPIYRRECFNDVYIGSHEYPGEGVYLLKFDNSYSIWRSKTLYYRVYYER